MSAFSNTLESELIDCTLRGGTYSGGPVYVALYTSDPTDADIGAELTDSVYARQQAHSSVVSDGFTADSDGLTSNGNVITFPAIADAQVTITHWAIKDALTGGNLRYHGALTNPKTLDPFDVLSLPIGSLSITLA